MTVEITEGAVDYLEILSACIEPIGSTSSHAIEFVMSSYRMNHLIRGRVSCFSGGNVICRSYSKVSLSSLAEKRLHQVMRGVAIDILEKLR